MGPINLCKEQHTRKMAPRTVLRLKRSAADATLDELAVAVPVPKRSRVGAAAPAASGSISVEPARTLRFRRITSAQLKTAQHPSNIGAPVQPPNIIDLDLSAVLKGPPTAPTTAAPKPAPPTAHCTRNTAGAPKGPTVPIVYDLYEAASDLVVTGAPDDAKCMAWIDSSLLPSEFFGTLLSSDEDDNDYSEGDERSVDYPSTPESGGADDSSQISEGELDVLGTTPVLGIRDHWSSARVVGYQTRSRFQDRRFDGASDSDDGI